MILDNLLHTTTLSLKNSQQKHFVYSIITETWTEAEVEELAVPASQSTALVEGLTPSSTYHLRVLAQNGVGFSPPSEGIFYALLVNNTRSHNIALHFVQVVQITTTEEAPEGPPLEVTVGAESSIRLRIVWAPPERAHWHGQILGYYLGFRELSLALADHPVLSLPGGGESTTTAMLGHGHSHSHSSNLGDLHGYHFKTVEVRMRSKLFSRQIFRLTFISFLLRILSCSYFLVNILIF